MLYSHPALSACLFSICLGALASHADAQQSQTLPAGFDTVDGNGATSFPQNNTNDHIWQWHYDNSNFVASFPILITEISVRAAAPGSTVNAFDFPDWEVTLIEASTDYQVGFHDPTFANNVLNQTVVRPAGTPWSIPAPILPSSGATATWIPMGLTVPMAYDPSLGNDFIVQIRKCGTTTSWGTSMDGASAGAGLNLGNRYGDTTNCQATMSTFQNNEFVPIVKIDYVPATGLFPNFSADVQAGPAPLTVNFTDLSYSSAPGGIVAWQWDFDNDGTIDSTVQNPTHTFTNCGDFDVSLIVIDTANPPATALELGFITTDLVTASFTSGYLSPPNSYQFTDTSTPTPTAWAWDFDNDGTVDSTLQNPVFAAPAACLITDVSLTVTYNCRSDSVVESTLLTPNSLTGTLFGGSGNSSATSVGNMFDISVTNTEGINLCGLTVTPYQTGLMEMEVYLTDGSYVGKDNAASQWRLIGTGSFISSGTAFNPPTPHTFIMNSPAYIPAGDYGLAVYMSNPTGSALLAHTAQTLGPFSDPNLTIMVGARGLVKTGLFGGFTLSPRIWNGSVLYSLCSETQEPSYGYYGPGCAGTNGVPSLTAVSPPRINTTLSVDIGNVGPAGVAIMSMGFSNTAAAGFGPLPFNGAPFGAPGCFLRMSAEGSVFLTGTPTATWNLPLPNSPSILCTQFYNQAFCLDTVNPLGFVASDAYAGMIGQ